MGLVDPAGGDDEHDRRDDQSKVNETARDVKGEVAAEPEHDEDDDEVWSAGPLGLLGGHVAAESRPRACSFRRSYGLLSRSSR
jgi:hypothetical protein